MENIKYYNNLYKKLPYKYICNYNQSPYYPIWIYICELIKDEKIIDAGCGTGQFAKMLIDRNKNYQLGIDYSKEAIKIAKNINFKNKEKFKVHNIFELNKLKIDYDLFLSLEVLEHINNDLELLEKIEKGKRIIFSVPNFWSKTHVRIFKYKKDVVLRYRELIRIGTIKIYNFPRSTSKIFILNGIKR